MKNIEWFDLLVRRVWRIIGVVVVLTSLLGTLVCASFWYSLFLKPGTSHSIFTYLLTSHCKYLVRILGIRVVCDPYGRVQKKSATLILSNHISYLDVLVLSAQWEAVFLAKSEVSEWPLIGRVARMCGTIFVKRSSLFSRAMCIESIHARLLRGQSVLVFPEGTTSIEGPLKKIRPFFNGSISAAKWADADLRLVYLEYEDVEDLAWLGDDALMPNLWKVLGRKSTKIRLREQFLEPLPTLQANESARYRLSPKQMRWWLAESGYSFS